MMSLKRLGRILLLTSAIAASASVLVLDQPRNQPQLTLALELPIHVDALPVRIALVRSATAQPSAPQPLPERPELAADAEPVGASDAATADKAAPSNLDYRPYRSSHADAVATELARSVKNTPRSAKAKPSDPAAPHKEARSSLCPVSASESQTSPACSAVDLFSSKGYLVLPRTHVHLGVATERVKVTVRLATF
ncbi:MAG: hypothetical protein IPI67_38905 [Myxococcales bacterium]|nr:hypothetical protein [Myxococcales bacterium]